MGRVRVLSPALFRAYCLTAYRAGALDVRVGRRARNVTERGDIVFLSACNPGGRRYPDRWNGRMMERLSEQLRRYDYIAGEGRLGRWAESLVAARMPLAKSLCLARLFRQNGVVLVRRDQIARLILLR
ncbi:DUF3293 domain-containing protein [Acetobacter oeni]|uniref:DUF3293 domain-containing protein n=1 Tax=Acetobacter oeni TaxID=304077 RepID=A0A511XHX7_9PROT|nr:DUF3293 domain-containing protein [Acetobacter oeni]MBB3882502.1 hypothetical protein [Acetobacter oeni]NHO18686.1 DUF3293 domain-containing protein [Acetobacter oeni]GBR11787.1 hypothetical protein AA21952_3452 [Acetobacter oeni LMG 21952]GEN62560.1 hypothetical protein AOE01nite_07840 [Acetobacter oeni]